MESYINYLLNKYLIFENNVNIGVGDELKDLEKFKCDIKKDIDFIKITKGILDEFLCFEIKKTVHNLSFFYINIK